MWTTLKPLAVTTTFMIVIINLTVPSKVFSQIFFPPGKQNFFSNERFPFL